MKIFPRYPSCDIIYSMIKGNCTVLLHPVDSYILQQFRPHYSQNCTNALTLAEQLLYISSTFCAIIHLTQLLYCVYRKRQIGGKRDEAFTGRTQKQRGMGSRRHRPPRLWCRKRSKKKHRQLPDGPIWGSAIFSVFSSAVSLTDCWKTENWTRLSLV